jgi:hypothetical protein
MSVIKDFIPPQTPEDFQAILVALLNDQLPFVFAVGGSADEVEVQFCGDSDHLGVVYLRTTSFEEHVKRENTEAWIAPSKN